MVQWGWLIPSSIWVSISTVTLLPSPKECLSHPLPGERAFGSSHCWHPPSQGSAQQDLSDLLAPSTLAAWRSGVGWMCPSRQAWPARWGGRSLQRVLQPQLPSLPGAVGLRGHRRVGRNTGGTLAGRGCVSKRFNRRASCLAGLFSRSSVHGSPWFGVKGKFLLRSSKTQGFSRASSMGKDAGLALTML